MRAVVCALLLLAGADAGAGGGIIVYTGPDGSRRVANVAAASQPARVPVAPEARRSVLWPVVQESAAKHGLDPHLVDLVIRMESGYNPRAVSPKGASGVMQLMPGTARLYGVKDVFDAVENIRGGTQYLADLLRRFSFDLRLALAAYNAGPEAVARYNGVPPYAETQNYVHSILGAYNGGGQTPRLTGGFGRTPAVAPRPVTVTAEGSGTLISNVRRGGESLPLRRLSLQ